jgi:calcineurin-like phosphoesterase family protein
LADHGLIKEYEMFSEYMSQLNVPFLTCIGNHDYLSNGSLIYESMFGELNHSLIYKNRKLIFFDATTLESNKQPDMVWFSDQLESDNLPKLIFSHIPPWDDQYSEENTEFYKSLLNNNIILSMHGHKHSFYYGNKLETEVNFLVVSEIKKRQMIRVTIQADNSYSFERIDF